MMFEPHRKPLGRSTAVTLESLENRRLLSGSPHGGFGHGRGGGHAGPGEFGGPGGPGGQTIAFSLAPATVQTGLDNLASTDGLTVPADTQLVTLGNSNGVETYSITLNGTGTVTKLTVDQSGNAVTAPTRSTNTLANISSGASAEITAIAAALNLSAPASTDTVNVSNTSAGVVTYSIRLSDASTTDSDDHGGRVVTVDSDGNPVGNQKLPIGVFSTTITAGLSALAPSGATAPTSVDVRTIDGVVTYSAIYTSSGTTTTVTVDKTGVAVSLPTTTTTVFSNLSSGVKTELQTLATADGATTTIADTQVVSVYTEANGTVIYSVTVSATSSTDSTVTYDVTLSVDSAGNPTVLPRGGGGFRGEFGGPSGIGGPGDCGPVTNGGTNTSSGTTTNASNGSSSTTVNGGSISLDTSAGTVTATTASISAVVYKLEAKLLSAATNGLNMLGGVFAQFLPSSVDDAVKTDVAAIVAAQKQLVADTKSLSKTEKATLKTDTKAISAAVKALGSTIAPLQATLKADAAKWKSTLKSDAAAVRKAKGDSTALAAAKAALAADQASAFTAIADDQTAIQSAIDSDAGVVAARAKLAADLPTIAGDQSTVRSDQSQLIADVESQLAAT